MKIEYKISLVIVGILLAGFIGFSLKENNKLAGSADLAVFQNSATNSSSTASSSVALLVSQNSGRQLLRICNDGANVVYVSEKTTSTGVTANIGQRLNAVSNANSCYETGFNEGYVYTGQIWGITASGTSTLTIFER